MASSNKAPANSGKSYHQTQVTWVPEIRDPQNGAQPWESDVYIKLASRIRNNDTGDLAKIIINGCLDNKVGIFVSDVNKVWEEVFLVKLQALVDSTIKEMVADKKLSVSERKPGVVMREQLVPNKIASAIIIDVKTMNLETVDQTKWEIDMLAVCANPLCNLAGQYKTKVQIAPEHCHYYCPKCETTWHWTYRANDGMEVKR